MPEFTLDHVVIAVRDLDGATADYAALLGRSPSWRGSHPKYGTRNALFRIDNTYVELLSVGKRKSGRWAGELSKFLEAGEGLYALALGTPDIDADMRVLRAHELAVQDPADGEGIDELSGNRRMWRNAMVSVKASRDQPTCRHDAKIPDATMMATLHSATGEKRSAARRASGS